MSSTSSADATSHEARRASRPLRDTTRACLLAQPAAALGSCSTARARRATVRPAQRTTALPAQRGAALRVGLLALLVALALPCACRRSHAVAGPTDAEILWDRWGVPHIEARDARALSRAFGWAQAHSHGALLLTLYAQARGRAAELLGAEHVASDRWVWTVGIPERARDWYERQTAEARERLDAFASGVNAYVAAHEREFDASLRAVLPVTGTDLLAHQQRVLHFGFVAPESLAGDARARPSGGSNAWAIAPARSASGNALLLANPHLPWGDRYVFYEAQLACPTFRAYGAAIVGFPVLVGGFNERVAWTHTLNTHDGADLYELALDGDTYRIDGEPHALEHARHELRVRRADGSLDTQSLDVRLSLHGPLISGDASKALALRVVGLDRPASFEQWWRMGTAQGLAEFEDALRMQQLPTLTVMYADADGHVLHLFGGLTPVRARAERDWSGSVPGDTSQTLWTRVHGYDELPRVVDPPSGWLQNSNDPPWNTTQPAPLSPDDFPAYMAPRAMSLRAQRASRLLGDGAPLSMERVLALQQETRVELADRVLDELLPLARASDDPLVVRAAEVLEHWDRCTEPQSRGAVLFMRWVQELTAASGDASWFATDWRATEPLTTPDGLRDAARALAALRNAARVVESFCGKLDVAWGDVFRMQRGEHDLPASGGMAQLGILRVLEFGGAPGGKSRAISGDSFIAAIELSSPPRASVLLTYGNATQKGSEHVGDQLELFAKKQMRKALWTRAEVEAELESREWVP